MAFRDLDRELAEEFGLYSVAELDTERAREYEAGRHEYATDLARRAQEAERKWREEMRSQKVCAGCGKKGLPPYARRFCNSCSKIRLSQERTCIRCGKKGLPVGFVKYCGEECREATYTEKHTIARRARNDALRLPCRRCGKEIKGALRGGERYCRKPCAELARQEELARARKSRRQRNAKGYARVEARERRLKLAQAVLADFAREHGLALGALCGPCRTAKMTLLRAQVARELHDAGYSSREIGEALNRNHASILNLLRKYQ